MRSRYASQQSERKFAMRVNRVLTATLLALTAAAATAQEAPAAPAAQAARVETQTQSSESKAPAASVQVSAADESAGATAAHRAKRSDWNHIYGASRAHSPYKAASAV